MIKRINFSYRLTLFLVFLMIIIFFVNLPRMPHEIPLFYSQREGNDQVVNLYIILILPALTLIITTANNIILRVFLKDSEFIGKIIRFVNLIIVGAFFIIFARIIFLVA